jgi:hypothetical protein
VYRDGTLVISGEAGYGSGLHVQDRFTGLDFVNVGLRIGLIPFGVAGPGVLRGALEVGEAAGDAGERVEHPPE